jgi:DNA polymerase-1
VIIATWNLNSIRTRRARLLSWLERFEPDVLCLQELKVEEADFPFDALGELGYRAAVYGQKTYNGVAIVCRSEPGDVRRGFDDGDTEDVQARLIAATVGDVRVISAYMPNGGQVGSDKYAYKLAWMARFRGYLDRHCDPDEPLALCGDFNVAPEDIDVAFPEAWAESTLCWPDSRSALETIREWGLVDAFRLHNVGPGHYSWWDYRNAAFPRDDGLRIDHVFVTTSLAARCKGASIDRDERGGDKPSDHAPVLAWFDQEPSGEGGLLRDASGQPARLAKDAQQPSHAEPSRPSDEVGTPADAGRQPKLVLIDGHSLAYRAFYGLPLYDRHGNVTFSNSKGELTNAVYGFANTLIKTWREERPDYIAVAFDLGRTFRDDLYEDYKATREKMPDELASQMDRIVELVEAFGIPAVTAEGYEADDILGTLAKRAEADGMDVLIVTGDSDAFQLVDDHIHVQAPGRLWSDVKEHDVAAIEKKYGLEPGQLIDFKALVGDSSDNVPGVKGVGKKTAEPLLKEYGSVEGIYQHLDDVESTRARNALAKGEDMALLSKDLVTIRTDVPIDVDWHDCAVRDYDRERVERLFDELEFRSLRSRLPGAATSDAGETDVGQGTTGAAKAGGREFTTQMRMFDDAAGVGGAAGGSEARGLGEAGEAGAEGGEPPTATTIVRDADALRALVAELGEADVVSFDTEATSTDKMRADLVGVSLTASEGSGFYLPVGHAGEADQLTQEQLVEVLGPLLADASIPKVAHNAKYDMAVLRRAGIEVAGLTFDTMLAEFLIDPGGRFGLKAVARQRLGVEMTPISELIGKGRKQITMAEVPVERAAPYAAADVDMTLRIKGQQESILEQLGLRHLLDDVDLPLVPVLLDMEQAGVLIDTELLATMSEDLAARLMEIEDQVFQLVGQQFNINSPQQLGEVLFEQLKLEAPRARKTRTGRVSVAADVLESMRGEHPVIDLVLEHRQLSKLKGTYIDALPRLVNPETGRVHTSFNQVGAVSGRLASQDPNLQNIPIRTELGREVRRAFIVPEGWLMIAADYSQVELRVVAHLCGDPGLRAAFAAGEDIHRATAAKVLGIPPEEVTPDQRSFAKRVNFGLLYGMGARSLARQAGIPMNEAQEFVKAYFNGFPNIKAFIEDTKRKARQDGYVETLLGRRRYFPILEATMRDNRTRVMQAQAEREAVNHPVQGSAADIMKLAMIDVHRKLAEGGYRARMLLQVHDELVLEAPEDEVEQVSELVKATMEAAYELDPPLKADVGVGPNWTDAK